MSDLALRLQHDGYRGLERDRAARRGAQTYATRLLGRRAVVLGGAAGAALFYDEEVVQRHGAVPPPLAWLLFGRGAVHGLDGEEHQQRKSLFLSMLGPADVAACAAEAGRRLEGAVQGWRGCTIRVHDELVVASAQPWSVGSGSTSTRTSPAASRAATPGSSTGSASREPPTHEPGRHACSPTGGPRP